ncbi:hypothetical protein EYF80_048033 [Liparis tanakae]|uniref:Uncharacterized protein n=1 Tax=Liparis tanakae TaxID=230148 RepID=A0A4Z2FKW3_9TELE|nr:hypothetical protein EYF80_048033 [Liparis tanakae]
MARRRVEELTSSLPQEVESVRVSVSPRDFTSHRVHWTWLGPYPCPCYLHPSSGLDLASFPMALPPSLYLIGLLNASCMVGPM